MRHPNLLNFVLTKTAAQILGLTPAGTRALETRGELPATRIDGVRLFDRRVVERLAKERASSKEDPAA
jgi:DNA-binding transcriptional MerR regulator